eukprot:1474867-Pleurochrysis_carterae.AAC.1
MSLTLRSAVPRKRARIYPQTKHAGPHLSPFKDSGPAPCAFPPPSSVGVRVDPLLPPRPLSHGAECQRLSMKAALPPSQKSWRIAAKAAGCSSVSRSGVSSAALSASPSARTSASASYLHAQSERRGDGDDADEDGGGGDKCGK